MKPPRPEVVDDLARCIIQAGARRLAAEAIDGLPSSQYDAYLRELEAAKEKLLAAIDSPRGV